MSKLTIGGFRKNNEENPIIKIESKEPVTENEVQETEEIQEVQKAEEVVETPVIEKPEEVIAETEKVQETEETQEVESKLEIVNNDIPTDSETEEVVQNSSINEPELESSKSIDDKQVLTYLSEKLGQEIKSLDELKPKDNTTDNDPYLNKLKEWRDKTGRPIEDFIKYQKDYSKMSDINVVREILQHKYPTLNADEIQLELSKYESSEDDLESDSKMKSLELKKLATEGRSILNEMKIQFEKPLFNDSLPPEVQEDLNLAKEVKNQRAELEKAQNEYNDNLNKASLSTEKIQLKLSDNFTVNYKVSDETRKELPNYLNEMPHWRNQDGSWNHSSVAEDGVKIRHFDEIIKLVYEQGVNTGKEELSKAANNITLDKQKSMSSEQVNSNKGIKIDGLDNFLGKSTIKFNKKR